MKRKKDILDKIDRLTKNKGRGKEPMTGLPSGTLKNVNGKPYEVSLNTRPSDGLDPSDTLSKLDRLIKKPEIQANAKAMVGKPWWAKLWRKIWKKSSK